MPTLTHPVTVEPPVTASTARPRRMDLEGLRTVAIALVAIYHVFFHRVSGGVDVFLMLSGFFVGGSLVRQFSSGRAPRWGTYLKKHALRLLPAAAVVITTTMVAAVIVLPATRWRVGALESLASLGFYENWQLVVEGQAYGAADAAQSPWQHFWSLSVQAQLFVAVPAALALVSLVLRRASATMRRRVVTGAVVVAFAASLTFAVILVGQDQTLAYFHTAARAWEFLAGALVAALIARWAPAGRAWAVVGWAGLAGLLLTGFLVDGGSTFPGLWALVPTGAAAAIILSGSARPHGALARTLGWRPLATAGRYAYAYYLWHWPLLVLWTAAVGRTLQWWEGALVLLGSAVLAPLTYHLVEEPVRHGSVRSPAKLAAGAVAWLCGLAIVGGAAYALVKVDGASDTIDADAALHDYPGALSVLQPGRYPASEGVDPIPDPLVVGGDGPLIDSLGCNTDLDSSEVVTCVFGNEESDVTVALVGASHEGQWFGPLEALAQEQGWRLVTYMKPGCPLVPAEDAAGEACNDWRTAVFDALAETPPDLVVVNSTRPVWGGGEEVPDSLIRRFEILGTRSDVIGIRDNAWFDQSMPECYLEDVDCSVPLYSRIERIDPTDGLMLANVAFVDFNDVICPDGTCTPVVGNRFVFRDSNHVSATFMETLNVVFSERVLAALSTLGWESGVPADAVAAR